MLSTTPTSPLRRSSDGWARATAGVHPPTHHAGWPYGGVGPLEPHVTPGRLFFHLQEFRMSDLLTPGPDIFFLQNSSVCPYDHTGRRPGVFFCRKSIAVCHLRHTGARFVLPPPEFFGVTIFALTPHVLLFCFPPPEFLGVARCALFCCFLPPEFLGVGRFELTPGSFESFFSSKISLCGISV